ITDADTLYLTSACALAMSMDACRATDAFLDIRLYEARSHNGITHAASDIRWMLKESPIVKSHVENDPRVQDPYSLRAGPTVLGAVWEAMFTLELSIEKELGSVTDNPLVFPRGKVRFRRDVNSVDSPAEAIISGANFHGAPLALPLDYLAIALCHLAGI